MRSVGGLVLIVVLLSTATAQPLFGQDFKDWLKKDATEANRFDTVPTEDAVDQAMETNPPAMTVPPTSSPKPRPKPPPPARPTKPTAFVPDGASPLYPFVKRAVLGLYEGKDASESNYVCVLNSGINALILRLHLIRNARKSIDVQVRSTDGACEAEVDPELIQQVFRNLLLNAIDAAPAASRLEIVIQNGVGEDEVAVAFHDEAGGIDENTLGRIFEPFFTSKAKGTGLGLAVSKKIVEVLGGRIEVQSQLGKGTSFTVALPRTHEKGAGVCAGCS